MIWAERVFTPGQRVKALCSVGYVITEGKEYVVHEYTPRARSENGHFTWPAYVTVTGDHGKLCTTHTQRFIAIDETNSPKD